MAITYPAGYRGGYPNIENLLQTLFLGLDGFTGVRPCYWITDDDITSTLESDEAVLRIFRTGGSVNHTENRDEPNVQFAALTKSRDDSWELIEFTRQVLGLYVDAVGVVPGTIHKLGCAGELIGPQLIPEQFWDERLVPVTFTLHTWKPGGLGNLREALGL